MASFSSHRFQSCFLLLIVVILGLATCMHGELQTNRLHELADMKPELNEQYYKVNQGRQDDVYQVTKSGEPFKVCGECKCCPQNGKGECKNNAPCCFKIVCNPPGKPFGYCSFMPFTCGCQDCKN